MKMKRNLVAVFIMLLMFMAFGCAAITPGATNTTATNVGVTSYESVGIALTQTFNAEKALLKAGKITADQDSAFQTGPYTKAYNCYKALGTTAIALLTITDTVNKLSANDKTLPIGQDAVNQQATLQVAFNSLSAQLPGLISDVEAFISSVKK